MLVARVCRQTLSPRVSSFLKTPVPKAQIARLFGNDTRSTFARSAKRRSQLAEETFAQPKDTAFNVGKGIVAGGSVVGLGALCYYGLGLSSATGAIDVAGLWPQYVRDRIKTTYLYFGGSIVTTGLAATACFRSPVIMNLVMKQGWLAMIGTMAAMIGSGMVCRSLPYKEGIGAKQVAWLVHSGIMGAVLAPMCLLGGPIVMRAAWYTAGVVGRLSAIAVCAPSEKFLNMGGPLAIGLGVVFASSIGSMFLPPTTALGAGVHSMALYGGLVLFSMFLLYDTQKIIKKAQQHPSNYYQAPYDPINNSINIYMDTLNIFVRILSILSGGGGNRK